MPDSFELIRVKTALIELLQTDGIRHKDYIQAIFSSSEISDLQLYHVLTAVHFHIRNTPIDIPQKEGQLKNLRKALLSASTVSENTEEIRHYQALYLQVNYACMFYQLGIDVGSTRKRS